MKKIKLIIAFLFCFTYSGIMAQESINASGNDATGSGGTAAYSVGQVVYTYESGSNGSSNQGVQQPIEFFVNGVDEAGDINLTMNVYPNPANTIINLEIGKSNFENLSYQLFDVTGKLLISEKINEARTPIPMESFSSGTYLLKIAELKNTLKSFTIIKNQ